MIFLTKSYLAGVWTSWISFILWTIGGFDLLIQSLITLIVLDYVTGLIIGYKNKNLNSKRAFMGFRKKFIILILVCAASVMHRLVPGIDFRTIVGLFYCSMEMLSIVENAGKLGVPIPTKLKKALEQCQDGNCNFYKDKGRK